jgi:hypothetical protein
MYDRPLSPSELEQLACELQDFARHLYSSDPFRRLYSLTDDEIRGKKPTFAIIALADAAGGACVFEYQPWACGFTPVETADPVSDYLAVYECWATDLLATLRAEISSFALGFGRYRGWNANPDAFHFTLSTRLFEYAHPLRQPERFLALYRRTLADLAAPSVRVAWNG